MDNPHRSLDEIRADIIQADDILHRAASKKTQLIDEHDRAKVASFDPALVEEARRIGVNPANFENDDHLKEGVARYKQDQEIVEAPTPPARIEDGRIIVNDELRDKINNTNIEERQ